jgi:hypothetical protein
MAAPASVLLKRWAYTLNVMVGVAWPSRRETVTGSILAAINALA